MEVIPDWGVPDESIGAPHHLSLLGPIATLVGQIRAPSPHFSREYIYCSVESTLKGNMLKSVRLCRFILSGPSGSSRQI